MIRCSPLQLDKIVASTASSMAQTACLCCDNDTNQAGAVLKTMPMFDDFIEHDGDMGGLTAWLIACNKWNISQLEAYRAKG